MLNKLTSDDGLYIGTFKGSKIYLAYSWFFIALVIIASFTPTVQEVIPHYSVFQAGLVAVCYVVFLALSILIHELFHALSAQRYGWNVNKIVLNVFGGITHFNMTTGAKNSQQAFVALMGPFANLIIAALAYFTVPLSPNITIALLLQSLFYVNLFVGLFNLLPAFPLDGGKALQAIINNYSTEKNLGLKVTAWIGRILCIVLAIWFIVLPLVQGQSLGLTSALISFLLISYLWQSSTQALNSLKPQIPFGLKNMEEAAIIIPSSTSCAIAKVLSQKYPHIGIFDGKNITGKVDTNILNSVPDTKLDSSPITAVSTPFPSKGLLLDTMSKTEVMKVASATSSPGFFIADEKGHVDGYVTYQQILAQAKAKTS
ncbi:MAG: site-2 protease family protein [Micrococcaceae bacterium]